MSYITSDVEILCELLFPVKTAYCPADSLLSLARFLGKIRVEEPKKANKKKNVFLPLKDEPRKKNCALLFCCSFGCKEKLVSALLVNEKILLFRKCQDGRPPYRHRLLHCKKEISLIGSHDVVVQRNALRELCIK
jgi:hypothetical protein